MPCWRLRQPVRRDAVLLGRRLSTADIKETRNFRRDDRRGRGRLRSVANGYWRACCWLEARGKARSVVIRKRHSQRVKICGPRELAN